MNDARREGFGRFLDATARPARPIPRYTPNLKDEPAPTIQKAYLTDDAQLITINTANETTARPATPQIDAGQFIGLTEYEARTEYQRQRMRDILTNWRPHNGSQNPQQ